MSKLKFLILGSFLLLSLIIPNTSLAVDAGTPVPVAGPENNKFTLVANVGIEEAKIVSQKNNIFNIAFTLTNGKGLQTDVKYGVQLMLDGAKYVADEKIYDESLTLYENSNIKKSITYTAPSTLGGSYNMYLVSNNASGLPLSVAVVGKVKLTASAKGIKILNDSCYLQVEGEKGAPHYTLIQNIDIKNTETLKLTCSAVNESNTALFLKPFFENRYSSAYGEVAPQTGGEYTTVTLAKGEKKAFTFALPKGTTAGFYNLKVTLMSATVSSNNLAINYIVDGPNAKIKKLSLNQDYYKSGDEGEMSVLWSASSGAFKRSGLKNIGAPKVTLEATITNDKGRQCASSIKQELLKDLNNPEAKIAFKAKAPCLNPQVLAMIIDENGTVLDQKTFSFKSNPQTTPKPNSKHTLIVIVIVLLVFIGLALFTRKKKSVKIQ
jgi:hypothetical protein